MVEESSEGGESQTHASKCLQELPGNMTPSDVDDSRPLPTSNKSTNEVDDTNKQGCSNMANAPKAVSVTSDTTANILQEMRGMRHELCGRHELCQNPSTGSDWNQSLRKRKKSNASSLTSQTSSNETSWRITFCIAII